MSQFLSNLSESQVLNGSSSSQLPISLHTLLDKSSITIKAHYLTTGKGENDPHSQLWQLRFTWVNVSNNIRKPSLKNCVD